MRVISLGETPVACLCWCSPARYSVQCYCHLWLPLDMHMLTVPASESFSSKGWYLSGPLADAV
jgi:hypothetical protein